MIRLDNNNKELQTGVLELKIIDGKINRFKYQSNKDFPVFVTIYYAERTFRSRGSAFHKGEQFPLWNHKFFIPIYSNFSEIKMTLSVVNEDGADEIFAEEETSTT